MSVCYLRNQENAGIVIPDGMPMLCLTAMVERSSLGMRTCSLMDCHYVCRSHYNLHNPPLPFIKMSKKCSVKGRTKMTLTELTRHPKLPNLLLNFFVLYKIY
jgi:hypothetical protein